jgi:hypothetical protein
MIMYYLFAKRSRESVVDKTINLPRRVFPSPIQARDLSVLFGSYGSYTSKTAGALSPKL